MCETVCEQLIIRNWCTELFGGQEEGVKTEAENWGVVCTYFLLLYFVNVLYSCVISTSNVVVTFYARDELLKTSHNSRQIFY